MERLDFEPKFRGFEGKCWRGERIRKQRKEAGEEKFIEKARR